MKKLIFNEGGQPVYLDDLQTIQEEIKVGTNIGSSFLTSNQRGYAVGRALIANESLSSTTYLVQAHRIVVDDEVYDIDAMTTAVSDLSSLYYHIRTTPEDARRTADGQTKACSVSRTGFISTNGSEDGVNGIAFADIPNFIDVVKNAISPKWVTENGVDIADYGIFKKIRIRYSGEAWSRMSIGYAFLWDSNSELYPLLLGKTSPVMLLGSTPGLGYLKFVESGAQIVLLSGNVEQYTGTEFSFEMIIDVKSE